MAPEQNIPRILKRKQYLQLLVIYFGLTNYSIPNYILLLQIVDYLGLDLISLVMYISFQAQKTLPTESSMSLSDLLLLIYSDKISSE